MVAYPYIIDIYIRSGFYSCYENFNKSFSTHLLFWGGVHYLTLLGLVKPVKRHFSVSCCFYQASSDCVVFVANGV